MAKLKENEVLGESGKVYEVVSVKMKYMKNGFYNNYMLLKEHGVMKLCHFADGNEISLNFLTAVFNSEELAKELIEGDDLDVKLMNEIIEITKKLNEIEDEPDIKNDLTPQE